MFALDSLPLISSNHWNTHKATVSCHDKKGAEIRRLWNELVSALQGTG
jgi:hypothetical protein